MFKLTNQKLLVELGKYDPNAGDISYSTVLNGTVIDSKRFNANRESDAQITKKIMRKFQLEVKAVIAIVNADINLNGNHNRIKAMMNSLKK